MLNGHFAVRGDKNSFHHFVVPLPLRWRLTASAILLQKALKTLAPSHIERPYDEVVV